MVSKKRFELKNINCARGIIIGFATLFVMFFHMYIDYHEIINNNFLANFLNFLHSCGNIGVDIFLMLSGIGLYFSYKKNNLSTFYKNRFIRVIPGFVLVTVAYFLYMGDVNKIFSVLSLISLILDGEKFLWYIQLIIILYIVFPIIYKIINDKGFAGLFVSICIVLLFNTIYSFINMSGYEKIEIASTRIPIFLIGTYFGKLIDNKKTISFQAIPICLICSIIIYVLIYFIFNGYRFIFVQRYLYCILAVCIVLLITYLYMILKNKNNFFLRIINFIGLYSLEIYLLHDNVTRIIAKNYINGSIVVITILSFIISIVGAIILKYILNSWIFIFSKRLGFKKT